LRELPAEADADTPLFRLLAGRGMFAAGRSPRVVRGRGDEVSLETPVDVAGLGPAWLRYFPAFWTDGAYRPDSVVLAARGSGRGWPGAMVFAVASSRGAVRLLRRDGAGPLEELRVESEQFVSVVHPDASGGESPPEPAAPAAPPDTLDFRRRPGYGMRRGLVFAYRSQRDAGSQVGWEVSVPGGDGSSTVLFYRGPAGAPEDDGTYYSRPDDEGLAHRLGSSQAMDLGGARTLQVGRERRLLIPRRGARGELVDPANGRAYAFRASGGCGAPRLEPSGGGGGSAGAPEAASKPAGGPSPRAGAPPAPPPSALPPGTAPPGPSAAPSSEPRPESPANGPAPAPAVVAPPPRDVSVPAAASALAESMAGGDGDKVAELAKRLAGLPGGPAALAALLEPGRPGLLLLVRALSYGNVGPAGPQALARLCGLLASADGELRPELVRTLLSQSEGANAAGGPNGVLLAGAADPAMELLAKAMPVAERLETVKLLGSLGRGAASTRWAEPLRKALAKEARSPEGETWREAAVGLARMPTVEAGQSVRELLQESEKIPGRTVALLQAFSHADIGEAGGGTIEGMRLLLNSKDPAVRLAAVEALLSHSEGANRKGHLNHPFYQGAVDEVIALLSGTADDALRLRAIALLGSMSRAAGWRPSSDQATIDFVRNVGRAGHTERWLRAIKAALEKQKGTLGASGTAAQRELEKSPPLQDLDAVPGEDVWALGGGVYELRRGSRAGRLAASANVGDRKVGVMISG
ncbi:MAG TPA: hypothetical protein VNI01_15305, partial [Elusimicrobiota bacterium]|nr:hypothetical protein [Elusimicrobiota bacterium]